MFKSSKNYLEYVIKRWKIIEIYFRNFRTQVGFSVIKVIKDIFFDSVIHIKTGCLCPSVIQLQFEK